MQPGHAQAPLQAPHSINAFGELSTGVRESSERESTQRESKYLDLDLQICSSKYLEILS